VTHDKEIGAGAKRPHAEAEPDGWSLKLTALSADEPERLVHYLTGALLACGGWVLTRTTQGNQAAELDFEFARDSHLQMADLCHCTKNLIESRAFDIARADLVVYHSTSSPHRDEYALAQTG
jgi:hypothetical protein